eukprot:Gregarina_sp_Poly_1__1867@NODE_1487_length_4016_cov_1152_468726_g985_i0_p1_GENE_NODE_1487_length_4016_cov_1152_468726_g985_i0NODE_1487_length_4016_cov_1152_468726_g985_i0_p1_ORF_typecomplete_len491_score69_96_NODE_1487_length_4016_cov_1152_468726_g985_i025433967
MAQEADPVWLSLEAECPYNLWTDDFNIVVCLFDAKGTLLSHLTTEDTVQHARVQVISVDHVAENKRRRVIRVDLTCATLKDSPQVAALTFGIFIPPPRPLEDFENLGHGIVNLKLDGRPILDFPLGYSKKMNAQILGSLFRDFRDQPLSAYSIDPVALPSWVEKHTSILKQWLLRFAVTTNLGYVEDMLEMIAQEFESNIPLIKHEVLNGCLPILRLLIGPSPSEAERKSALSFEKMGEESFLTKELTPRGMHSRDVLELPFHTISEATRRTWFRQNVVDENLRDLWKLFAALKTEMECHDNELALTAQLTRRIESFERLLLDMYHGSCRMTKNMRELMSLINTGDLQRFQYGKSLHNPKLIDLFEEAPNLSGCSADLCKREALEHLRRQEEYVEAAQNLESEFRRRDLHRIPTVSGPGISKDSRLVHMLERISQRPTVRALSTTLGKSIVHINTVPTNWPAALPAALTLVYDE